MSEAVLNGAPTRDLLDRGITRFVPKGRPLGYHREGGWHRVEFFYRNGLIPRMPTREQFEAGTAFFRLRPTIGRKLLPFARRLFSRDSWQRSKPTSSDPSNSIIGGTVYSYSGEHERGPGSRSETSWGAGATGLDALLARMTQVDVLRALVIHSVCPVAVTAGLGFEVGASHIVNHLLMSPHPCEHAVWDIQLIHPDPGGLDLFEERLEQVRRRKGLRARILRTLGTVRGHGSHLFELVRHVDEKSGEVTYIDATTAESGTVVTSEEDWERWYDHVGETIARARRFEYAKCAFPAPSVLEFLNLCVQLRPSDFEFFESRMIFDSFPEIDWPREDPLSSDLAA